ncbi:NADH-quinone oxidoreductase subunit N [Paradesertivirga mongoliensis]|uniref:NADH-quinone oxidoreductase subunit N n=1 Tax=Paradesertivirga mongoliensis TaxID=2100740 RepID=A0ABW4ZRJ4_9SPHI|nr:NADH-quinone oxidoreductase subunit N [Pedobacter mongoliensis]
MNEFLPHISQLIQSTLKGFSFLLQELVLVLTFILVILADLISHAKRSAWAYRICIAGIFLSTGVGFIQNSDIARVTLFDNSLILDSTSIAFKYIFSAVTILFAIFIRFHKPLQNHRKGVGDLYMLLPAVLIGLNLMSMASSLLMIYLSVEMVSIASYLMVGYASADKRQTEAAMKYALFGSICSAVMLYGMSLLYGFTGTLNIIDPVFLNRLDLISDPAVALAIVLVLVGIGFKLSFVPLHFWSPDVYEGAPTPVTAFLSTAPKIAGFAILIRFLEPFLLPAQSYKLPDLFDFRAVLSVVAIVTMILGNFSAIWQNNVKRMLAYSSIGHTGFALMALIAFEGSGFSSLIIYFIIYAIMNMAAFMLVDKVADHTGSTDIRTYKGLGKVLKVEFVCFVIVLVALTGLPPTAGFIAKLFVFSSAFEYYAASDSIWALGLLITGAVATVISLFYYLKIPLYAYLKNSEAAVAVHVKRDFLTVVIVFLTFLLILYGLFPGLLS